MTGGRFLRWLAYLTLCTLALFFIQHENPEISREIFRKIDGIFPYAQLNFSGWPDWIQAMSALVALTSAPALVGAIVRDFRSSIDVTFYTENYDENGFSKNWIIILKNKKEINSELNIHIYPHISGNILSSFHVGEFTGGVSARAAIDDNFDGHVCIDRMPKRSFLIIHANLAKIDHISLMSIEKKAYTKIKYEENSRKLMFFDGPSNNLLLLYHRVMLLLLLFFSLTIIIIVKIIYISTLIN